MAEIFAPLADRFLNGEFKSLVVVCPENERPLLGIGGYVDHKLKRPISQGLLSGFITGSPGECVYVPARLGDKEYSLFVVGCGPVKNAGSRGRLSAETLDNLIKNLKSMKLFPVGISKSDLGSLTDEELGQTFKNLEWVSET